jgi:selenide, water dikinase
VMVTLNKYAGEIVVQHEIHACTDITGFGLMGHAYEMAEGSKVSLRIFKDRIPYIEEAKEYAQMGFVPGGTYRNRSYLEGKFEMRDVPEWLSDLIFDPQTSGGLLVSCDKETAEELMKKLSQLDLESSIIGVVLPLQDKFIIVD